MGSYDTSILYKSYHLKFKNYKWNNILHNDIITDLKKYIEKQKNTEQNLIYTGSQWIKKIK